MPLQDAHACPRAGDLGPDGTIITVRSMDWVDDIHASQWAFPRGLKRDGAAGPASIEWTSKYGSVVAAGFDAASQMA